MSNSAPFGSVYSSTYDALYGEKDYAAEVASIAERLGRSEGAILDLGCGTGSHAALLARAGYVVTGVDRSADMLAIARAKNADVEFVCADLIDFDLEGRRFDGAIMMFAVLGYLVEPSAIAAALANVRRHLRPGAAFVFDFWFGPGVLRERPAQRVRTLQVGSVVYQRSATPSLDLLRQVVDVDYRLRDVAGDADDVHERHSMRFFFPRELELLLANASFGPPSLQAFPGGGAPDEATWNVLATAIAV